MMKTGIRLLVIGTALAQLAACTYIKNLFPDKEKDYQFTTEIPPLVIPPDLSGDAIAKVPAASPTDSSNPPAAETSETQAVQNPDAGSSTAEAAPEIERKSIQVELRDTDQGSKMLHIGAPVATSWRMVGKALSRNSIEVTNRNQEERTFRVHYEPNKSEVEDGSFVDEVKFFLQGFEITEQEYVLKLVEDNQKTHVMIMDKDQNPVADKTSLSFLTLLHDTIKADLAK